MTEFHKYTRTDKELKMRKKITIKGVDQDAVDMLFELREVERRFTGAVISDAIRTYHQFVFEDEAGPSGV